LSWTVGDRGLIADMFSLERGGVMCAVTFGRLFVKPRTSGGHFISLSGTSKAHHPFPRVHAAEREPSLGCA
jgi:hypothetical protein